LPVVRYEEANGIARADFDGLKKSLGVIPNLYASMANSAYALHANLVFDAELSKGVFRLVDKEIIKLAASQANNCLYCIAAHTMVLKLNKFDEAEILKIRRGTASNEKHAALARLAYAITETKGRPSSASLDAFFAVGYDNAALAEVIALVALNIMNNYMHEIGQAALDFPAAPALS
jgi:AhpD family alkylhydroperoxidase